ncbi:MAG: hypothetical protein ABIH23_21100, partial [bacterium]
MAYRSFLIVLVLLSVGVTDQVFAQTQPLDGPELAGITALTGDVVIGRGFGGTHKYAAAWLAIMPNGQILVAYPNPTEFELDGRIPYVDVVDHQGNILETRAAFHDDQGNPIESRPQGLGDDTRGIVVEASQSGESRYVCYCRLQPWYYQGPLAAWWNGTKPFEGAAGVGAGQVYAADGTALSPLFNMWTEAQIADSGDTRARAAAFLSNGNIAVNWWDQKVPAVGTTGDRWPGYEGTGKLVGICIVAPNGSVVLPPTPISEPTVDGAQTMRGMAAGNGWFCCRWEQVNEGIRYKVFDNAGNLLHTIAVNDAIEAVMPGVGGAAGGRGDSELMYGRGDYLYTMGGAGGNAYIGKWNAKAGTLVKMVQASEFGGYTGERMDVCCDDSGNVFAMWADQASG